MLGQTAAVLVALAARVALQVIPMLSARLSCFSACERPFTRSAYSRFGGNRGGVRGGVGSSRFLDNRALWDRTVQQTRGEARFAEPIRERRDRPGSTAVGGEAGGR